MLKKKLKNMDIKEVSLVDKGANRKKFLLIKREDGEITELTIKTDGTATGTTLSVNGEEVEDLKAFWFSLWPPDDFDAGMMNGSYTVSETDGTEFDRETTFNLKKGMNTMKLETVLKSLDIDPSSLSAERTQDLESLLKFVEMMPPDDGASALNIIKASLVKEETPAEAEEDEELPAGTVELSPEDVAEIRSAMSRLNGMLPESERVVIKSEEPSDLVQILTAIKGLKKTEDGESDEGGDDPPDSTKAILKILSKVDARLEKVEKTTGNSEEEEEQEEEELGSETPLSEEDRIKKYGSKYPNALSSWGHRLLQSQ